MKLGLTLVVFEEGAGFREIEMKVEKAFADGEASVSEEMGARLLAFVERELRELNDLLPYIREGK